MYTDKCIDMYIHVYIHRCIHMYMHTDCQPRSQRWGCELEPVPVVQILVVVICGHQPPRLQPPCAHVVEAVLNGRPVPRFVVHAVHAITQREYLSVCACMSVCMRVCVRACVAQQKYHAMNVAIFVRTDLHGEVVISSGLVVSEDILRLYREDCQDTCGLDREERALHHSRDRA